MPGRGRIDVRPFREIEQSAAARSVLLGIATQDIWMNGASYWRNVPEKVWDLRIGGYQVLKKWLSYREHSIIERPLNEPEVTHFQATARRLAALLLLGPVLDANYSSCAEAHRPLIRRRVLGRLEGQIKIREDFDTPLPDDILADFEGR